MGGQTSRKKEQELSLAPHIEQLKTEHQTEKQEREAATAGQGGFIASWQRGGKEEGREAEKGPKKHQKTAKREGVEEAKADKSGKIKGTWAGGGRGVENGHKKRVSPTSVLEVTLGGYRGFQCYFGSSLL